MTNHNTLIQQFNEPKQVIYYGASGQGTQSTMLHILAEVFGGLGLFFVGINLLSDNIKKLGSGCTPGIIRFFSRNDLSSIIGGLLSGIVTSSGKAVTFSLVALTELGQLNLRRSLPIVIGGSIGSAFIVLWASIDFELFIFILMGTAGVLYQFGNQKNTRQKYITRVILGFALLFYGLECIKLGAAPVKELPWFSEYLRASQGHWLISLLIGAVLSFISQSGSSVAIIAMSLVNAHMLGFDEAIMLVFGTNLGSGVSTAVLGLGLSGIGRQLVLFHGFFKIVGIFVMVPILMIEVYTGIPLIKAQAHRLSNIASTQIAIIYLLYELITGIVVYSFLPAFGRWFTASRANSVYTPPDILENLDSPYKIGLACPDNFNADSLIRALEQENIRITVINSYEADWRALVRKSGVQALLVELGSDFEHNFQLLENLLEEVNIPVFFNEHLEPDHPEFSQYQVGKQLLAKLSLHQPIALDSSQAAA